jgi:[acyl-carrier-protein] S-malonyltransferase
MGKDLAERFPACREVFQVIDDALGFSLSRLMWEGPEDELTLTHNAQPAILAHSLAVLALVRPAVNAVAGAGHSLGEYSAYAAADSLSPAEAARLVRKRGELMLESGRQRAGTMAAVLGLADDVLARVCSEASRNDSVVVPANLNAPGQTVISGDPDAVGRAAALCKVAGAKRVLPLKVSGAFHSPLMMPARRGLEDVLARAAFADPSFPVIANATTEPVDSAERGRTLLGEQLTSPVRWSACVRKAVEFAGPDVTFVELGPGSVLTGLVKRIDPDARRLTCGTVEEVESMMEMVA